MPRLPANVRNVLSQTIETISTSSPIHAHTRLSRNTILANFTTGMPNGVNAFSPIITSHLIDPRDFRVNQLLNSGVRFLLQPHKIARNLQHTAENIIEPLISAYGNDLTVYMGYLNPLQMRNIGNPRSKHFTGEAINIFLRSAQDNMFLEAESILDRIRGQYSKAALMFNHGSWLHIATDGPFSLIKQGMSNPSILSMDLISGASGNGLLPLRGAVRSPWEVLEYAPYRRVFSQALSLHRD